MKRIKIHQISNGILWGAAIIASAILGAPQLLTLVLLPLLALMAVGNFRDPGCLRSTR
ncbi:hypothetical protein [Microbulbifer sp. 2201CG32-9]|uniref:hypothetical protein n=1 Tax=unclassified Microbulbifer TaxID=2619833 RepID=UPI00345C1D25